MKKIIPIVFITILAFSACSNEEEVDNSRQEIKIVASIEESGKARTKASFNPDGSGTFDNGDTFSILALNPSGNGYGWIHEVGGSSSFYWNSILSSPNETTADFRAWYPDYVFSGDYTRLYEVATATSEDDKDLLIAPKVTVTKGDVVNLQFKHVMHKLTVNLSSNYFPTSSLDNAIISLKNLKSSAMVDFWDATVNISLANGTELYASKQGVATTFIVAPQTLTVGTEMIEVALDGKTFTYKVPATLASLESGQALTLSLTLKKNSSVAEGVPDFNPGGGWGN